MPFVASQVRLFLVLLFEVIRLTSLIKLVFLVVLNLIVDALLLVVGGGRSWIRLELLRALTLDDLYSLGEGDVAAGLRSLLPGPRRLLVGPLADLHPLLI